MPARPASATPPPPPVSEIDRLKARVQSLEGALAAAEEKIRRADAEEQARVAQLAALAREHTAAVQARTVAADQLKRAGERIRNLEEALLATENQIAQVEEARRTAEERADAVERAASVLGRELTHARSRAVAPDAAADQIADLRGQIAVYEEAAVAAGAELGALEEEVVLLRRRLAELEVSPLIRPVEEPATRR